MKIKRGSTSVRRLIFIGDSSSTTGAGLASLVYNSASLVAYYFAGDLSNEVAISLASATLGTYTSGGFVAVDNTNMPGWYEIGIPDAALDAGNEVAIQLRGATNMVPVNIYIELDTVDYQTDAFGALKPTTAGRTLDVSAGGEAGVDWANVGSPTTTVALTGTTVDLTTTALGAIWNRLTSSMTTAGSIGKWIVDNLTGDIYARLGAPAGASIAADIAALKAETATIVVDTNELQTDWADGGRLDLILDARASQTSVNTAQADLDTITGSDGVTLATTQSLYAPSRAGDAMTLTTAGSQAFIELCFTYDATAAYSTATTGSLVKEIANNAGVASLTVEDIADAVWDELLAGHATTGSVGAALTSAASGGGSGTESDLMVSTTINTLTSQTVFTLTAGSADDDAYNRQLVVITDAATSTQKARGIVSDYVGSTKTVTLTGAPAFTIAAGDSISIIAVGSDVSSTQVLSAVSSAVVSAGITTTVTGMPTFLRVGDARTVANGGAIPVRLYDVDDDSLLFGLGESLFADATITFSLRRAGTDSAEGAEDAAIPCTWVEDGADGYVQIAYDADALDDCDAMDRLKEKDCHRWGIKFQWGTDDPITPIYGNISVLRKIVTTQS